MFDMRLHRKDFAYVGSRFVIPSDIEGKAVHDYVLGVAKGKFKDDVLGVYLVWDTYNGSKKHNNKDYARANGILDLYLHVYVFTGKRLKPYYMQAKYPCVIATKLGKTDRNAKEWCVDNTNGGLAQKVIKVISVDTLINETFLKGVYENRIYVPNVSSGNTLSEELPQLVEKYTNVHLNEFTDLIKSLNICDGVQINPFYIIKTSETHSVETLNQAYLFAKLLGGMLELNRLTTHFQRTRVKRFRELYNVMYPHRFQEFYERNSECLSVVKIFAGAYTPVECAVQLNYTSDNYYEVVMFNPFASIQIDVTERGITINTLHHLSRQSYEESMKVINSNLFNELLPCNEKVS